MRHTEIDNTSKKNFFTSNTDKVILTSCVKSDFPVCMCVSSLSRGRRKYAQDTWAGQGSWSSSGERLRWRCLRDCVLASRRPGEGTELSNRSSYWDEARRNSSEAGTALPLCTASWTGRRTSRLPPAGQRRQRFSEVMVRNEMKPRAEVLPQWAGRRWQQRRRTSHICSWSRLRLS